MLDQLRALGAPADVLQAYAARADAEAKQATVPIWPENWHAVQVFGAMATQWHWLVGMGGAQRVGLRLEALPAVLPAVKRQVIRRWRQPHHVLLRQLQNMEDAALDAWAQQAS